MTWWALLDALVTGATLALFLWHRSHRANTPLSPCAEDYRHMRCAACGQTIARRRLSESTDDGE